jgi:peptide/nickel transport system substrate-binding protein
MRKLSLLVLLLLFTGVLAACGAGSSAGVLRVASGTDPVTFDMHRTNDQATARVARQIYDTLIVQSNDLELEPGLATSWRQIDDTTFEFELRQGVVFHNGEPFTAEDVVFSIRRALTLEGSVVSHIVGAIDPDGFEIIDDHTLRVSTLYPFGPFFTHMAHAATAIMNEKAFLDAGDDYGTSIAIGTGPFKLTEWQTDTKITLSRFDDYWGDAPTFEQIEFYVVVESSVRVIGLENGEYDIVYDVAPSDIATVEGNDGLTLINTPNLGAEYLGLNTASNPYLQDINVRKAIAHVIDVDAIISAIYNNVGEQLTGPISPAVFGFNPNIDPIPFDVDLAKGFLSQSEWPNGGFTLRLFVGDNSAERIRVAQVVQEQLQTHLNITVQLNQMEWGAFLAKTREEADVSETDMFLLGWTTVTADADYGLYPLFHSDNAPLGGNRTFFINERVDELLTAGRQSVDQEERLALYQEAQEIIAAELPWVFLQTRENVSAHSNSIQGFEHHPMGTYFLAYVSRED